MANHNGQLHLREPGFRLAYPLLSTITIFLGLLAIPIFFYFPAAHRLVCDRHPENPDWLMKTAVRTFAEQTQTTFVVTAIDSELSEDPSQWRVCWNERFPQPSTGRFATIELVWSVRSRTIALELASHLRPTGKVAKFEPGVERHQYGQDVGKVTLPAGLSHDRVANYAALGPLYYSLTGQDEFPEFTERALAAKVQLAAEDHERQLTGPVLKAFLVSLPFIWTGWLIVWVILPLLEVSRTLGQLVAILTNSGLACPPPPNLWRLSLARQPFETAVRYAEGLAGLSNRRLYEIRRHNRRADKQAQEEQRLSPLRAELATCLTVLPTILLNLPCDDAIACQLVDDIQNEKLAIEDRLAAAHCLDKHFQKGQQKPEHIRLTEEVQAINTVGLSPAALGRFREAKAKAEAEQRPRKQAYWYQRALEAVRQK